jgi:cysteine desulfurase
MNKCVYLDHNATTAVTSEVAAMISDTLKLNGNASSIHASGRLARQRVEDARDKVASLVGVRAQEIVFTGGGTEANNLALNGINCDQIMVSSVEHDSVLNTAGNLMLLSVDTNGLIDLEGFEQRLAETEGRVLVSVMLANNETGVIQPISEVARIAKRYGAIVHTDAIQACGKIKLDREALGVDFLSLSAHKIGGPQGVGALVINEELPLEPIIRGGGQERGRRAGTENIAGISGFGVASAMAADLAYVNKSRELRDILESTIKKIAPGIIIFGEDVSRLPNTSCIYMPGVSSETQVMKFDLKGIMVSAGSACSSGKVQLSHVLSAMGIENSIASNVIRISLGNVNTIDDVNYFIQEWKNIYMSANANKFMEVA